MPGGIHTASPARSLLIAATAAGSQQERHQQDQRQPTSILHISPSLSENMLSAHLNRSQAHRGRTVHITRAITAFCTCSRFSASSKAAESQPLPEVLSMT